MEFFLQAFNKESDFYLIFLSYPKRMEKSLRRYQKNRRKKLNTEDTENTERPFVGAKSPVLSVFENVSFRTSKGRRNLYEVV